MVYWAGLPKRDRVDAPWGGEGSSYCLRRRQMSCLYWQGRIFHTDWQLHDDSPEGATCHTGRVWWDNLPPDGTGHSLPSEPWIMHYVIQSVANEVPVLPALFWTSAIIGHFVHGVVRIMLGRAWLLGAWWIADYETLHVCRVSYCQQYVKKLVVTQWPN